MPNIFIFDEHGSSMQNGIGTFLHSLTSCLKGHAHITVFSFNDNVRFITRETIDGITRYRFPVYCNGSFLGNNEAGLAVIRTEITDSCKNVFIVNHFICTSLLKNLRTFFPLSKQIFVIHDQLWTETLYGDETLLYKTEDTLIKNLIDTEKEMFSLPDAVVCINKDTHTLLQNIYKIPKEKIFLIYSGLHYGNTNITRSAARKKLHIAPTEKLFLFVGRTTKFKGIHIVLAAFEEVLKTHPEARLAILGQIYTLGDLTPICPNSISRVIFAGQVSTEVIHLWYAASDFGIVCSYYEQCGYAGIEMMAHKLPVIASDALGVRCMFKDNYNAIITPIGDRTSPSSFKFNLTASMLKALNLNAEHIRRLCKNGWTLYNERYTLASMREGYLNMFSYLLRDSKDIDTKRENACNTILPHKDWLHHLIIRCCDISDNGLLTGKMGIALALFTYAKDNNCCAVRDFALSLLKQVINSLHKTMPISLGKGLCGIGWAIEYLVQKNLMHGNTVELCTEIDQHVSRISPLRFSDYSLENGMEGILTYINSHIAGNKDLSLFPPSFIFELKTLALSNNITTGGVAKQLQIFMSIIEGNSSHVDMNLRQFVLGEQKSLVNMNKLGLRDGLAGLLLA